MIGKNDFLIPNIIRKMSYTIQSYSEKAIAVFGDTTGITDILESVGGKYNAKLKGGAGWIFPKGKESVLKSALANGSNAITKPKSKEVDADDCEDESDEVVPRRLLGSRSSASSSVPTSSVPTSSIRTSSSLLANTSSSTPTQFKQTNSMMDVLLEINRKLDLLLSKV